MVDVLLQDNTDSCNGVSPLSSSDTSPVHYPNSDASPVHYPSSDTSPVHYPNGVADVDGSPGLSLADSGHRVLLQDLDFLPTKDDNNMPAKDGSNLLTSDGNISPGKDRDCSNLPVEADGMMVFCMEVFESAAVLKSSPLLKKKEKKIHWKTYI